ncbi:MAG: protein kinase [Myxococcota bacterium]
MRILVWLLSLLLSLPLLLSGLLFCLVGLSGVERVGAIEQRVRDHVMEAARNRGLERDRMPALEIRVGQVFRGLCGPLGYGTLLGLGLLGLGVAVRGAEDDRGEIDEASAGRASEEGPRRRGGLSRAEVRRLVRAAATLEETEGPDAAGEFLVTHGLFDAAIELYVRHGRVEAAAQLLQEQNDLPRAAELFRRAGRHEAAGAILAQLERHEEAARCYLEAGKFSIAGELFERAGQHREAGRSYCEIGFHRHAAQAFLKAGAEPEAAESLLAAFDEEGGGANAQGAKAEELRALACKAAELLTRLERFDEAEAILVRAGAFARAAKVALLSGANERAAELFLRIGRGDLAAKALERARDEIGAARVLGEYLRDKGQDEAAVVQLEKAGDFPAAADLYRRLERFEEAGECYWKAEVFDAAAEMFHVSGQLERAAECFERAGRYDDAAQCYGEAGEPLRRAEMLEKAGRLLEAGELYGAQQRPDDAIRVLQRIEADDEDFSRAAGLLGRAFRERGMDSLSLKKLEEATSAGPVTQESVEAYLQLAELYEEREQHGEAVALYEKILSFDYHYGNVAERLERARQLREQKGSEAGARRAPSGSAAAAVGVSKEPRYEIVRELGRGGMGVVYLARDRVLERDVAYKVMAEALRGNSTALRSFLREAKAAAQLNHPNIVTVYDAGDSEHGFYVAMEYVEGTTLKEIVQRRGAIPSGGAVWILRQMAEALSYAHSRRVVHRDIKTANTMWTPDKQVKIMDFGLAKLMEEVRNATTQVSGTPFYMSPEQALGQSVDHRTDLYSLGVMMFELATGTLPFRKGNVPHHHVHTPPPDPRELRPDLPAGLARIILRCLEKDPDARYQDASEIAEFLRQQS